MSVYSESTAIVTGAGSGIGLALSKALVARGAFVYLTDINLEAAEAAAEGLGTKARASLLDVRDGSAFARVASEINEERGSVDLLFNNAGIGLGGEMHKLSAEHFDRVIDINIRGVMNGIAAVYPGMVSQGSGHIVNTASAAGLVPIPLLTPYAMSKHAVVGLSTSLRFEAANYGVRVSALCPSAIDTPLLDTEGPSDLPQVWRPHLRRYLTKLAGAPFPTETFVEYALDQLAANRGLIVAPASARMTARLARWFPGLVAGRIRGAMNEELEERPPG